MFVACTCRILYYYSHNYIRHEYAETCHLSELALFYNYLLHDTDQCFIECFCIRTFLNNMQSVTRQDLLRGGAKIEIMSWSTHGGLQGRVQQLIDD